MSEQLPIESSKSAENEPSMEYSKSSDGTIRIKILSSLGATTQKGTWIINDQEKEPTEPVWPLITEKIEQIHERGDGGNIHHIMISPAVAIHLAFEEILTEEHFQNGEETAGYATFNNVTFTTPEGSKQMPLVVEHDMLHKRDGYDVLIMDIDNNIL